MADDLNKLLVAFKKEAKLALAETGMGPSTAIIAAAVRVAFPSTTSNRELARWFHALANEFENSTTERTQNENDSMP